MRVPGQLPTHARPAPQPFAADPLRGGTRSTPSSGRDSPGRVSLFIRAVFIAPCPYSGIHTSADQQSLTVNTTRFSKAGPSPQRAGHRFAACSAHRLFRHPDGPKRPGNAAVPRRGRFRQAYRKRIFSFPGRLSRPPPAPIPWARKAPPFPARTVSPRHRLLCLPFRLISRTISPHLHLSGSFLLVGSRFSHFAPFRQQRDAAADSRDGVGRSLFPASRRLLRA